MTGGSGVFAAASYQHKSHCVIVKMVNTIGDRQTVSVTLAGAGPISPVGRATVMYADSATATNTLERPWRVVPVTTSVSGLARQFQWPLPPYSVTVLEVTAR